MTRIVIVLDIDNVDSTLADPHDVADALLNERLPTFQVGSLFRTPDSYDLAEPISGTYLSAEWAE